MKSIQRMRWSVFDRFWNQSENDMYLSLNSLPIFFPDAANTSFPEVTPACLLRQSSHIIVKQYPLSGGERM